MSFPGVRKKKQKTMDNNNTTLNEIEEAQRAFYASSSKNMFFNKKAQKLECAMSVSETLSLDRLLASTVKVLVSGDGRYALVVDYLLLKTFANPSNYEAIAQYGLEMINRCMEQSIDGKYHVHFNLQQFTMSAMERYTPLVETFFRAMDPNDFRLYNMLDGLTIYNAPSFFDMMYKMVSRFVTSDSSRVKTTIYAKGQESELQWMAITAAVA